MATVTDHNSLDDKPPNSLKDLRTSIDNTNVSTFRESSNQMKEIPTEQTVPRIGVCKNLLMHSCQRQLPWLDFVDSVEGESGHLRAESARVSYWEIFSTALSIVVRSLAVYINVKLAMDYYRQGHLNYFYWTVTCILLPVCVTTLIHTNMCYQDGKFSRGLWTALRTLWLVVVSSFIFRYWNALMYAIRCKLAEIKGDRLSQLKNYKLNIREESDIAFIRLFECFLEAAPQKILQISIVLANINKMSNLQVLAICSYFGSMTWCLSAYHRYNRYAQSDKYNISLPGIGLQLCWHFCLSVSRTLSIAFVASIFPLYSLIGCLSHGLLLGFITFTIDRPHFTPNSTIGNFCFCLILGIVYIFTYIPVRDAPTRYKYMLYYLFCFLENLICILLFINYASAELTRNTWLFSILCSLTLVLYFIGLLFMLIYYVCCHPRLTARTMASPYSHTNNSFNNLFC